MDINSEQSPLSLPDAAPGAAHEAVPPVQRKGTREPPALLLLLIGLAIVTLILGALAFWLAGSVRRMEAAVAQQAAALATVEARAATQVARAAAAQAAAQATVQATIQAAAQATVQAAAASLAEEQNRSAAYSRIVRANQLANNALLALDRRPQAALLLAVESLRTQTENGEAPLPESVQRLRTILGATGGIPLRTEQQETTALAVSPDERFAAAADATGVVRIWDLQDLARAPRDFPGHIGPVYALLFGRQGDDLYSAGADGAVRRWPLPLWPEVGAPGTSTPVPSIPVPDSEGTLLPNPQAAPLYALAQAPDGRALAAAGEDGAVLLWRSRDPTGTLVAAPTAKFPGEPLALRGHAGAVNAVAFSPDGGLLASGGNDGAVRFWNTQNGEQQAVMPPPGDTRQVSFINRILFSPDGRWLASGGNNGDVRLWRTPAPAGPDAGEVDATVTSIPLLGHDYPVYALDFSPDGRWLATADENGEVRLWNVTEPDDNVLLGRHAGNVRGLVFAASPAGPILASTGYDGEVRLWDYRNPDAEPRVVRGHDGAINLLAAPQVAAPGATTLLVTAGYDSSLRVWRTASPFAEPHQVLPAGEGVLDVVVSAGGAQLAAFAEDDAAIGVWDAATGQPQFTLAEGAADITAIAYSPRAQVLWAGSEDGAITAWDTAEGVLLRRFDGGDGAIRTLAESPAGTALASGGEDGAIRLWDPARGSLLRELSGHTGAVNGLAFTADGSTLVSSERASGTLRLWDVATGAPRQVLQGPPEGLLDVAVQPRGPWLVGAGEDGAVWVWNADALAFAPARLTRHGTEVNAVNFSADGQVLASAGADGAVYLWSTVNPSAEPDVLAGSGASVNGVSFAPDGAWVASGSADGAIRRWSLNLDDLIAAACRTAGRNFTLEEWTQYFPTDVSSYRKTCPELQGP